MRKRRRTTKRAATPELEVLPKAAAGLLYPSESDAPFDVVHWPAGGGNAREQVVAHTKAGRAVDEVPVETIFAELEGTDDAERFATLRKALETTLTDLRVFRVGSGKIDVYIVGRTRSGELAGLHTTLVET